MKLAWTETRLASRNCLIFLVALVVSGCIVPRAATDKYSPPTSSDLSELAIIHVYRVRAFLASGNDFDIVVDGKTAGEIGNGESLSVRVEPGIHIIGLYDWNSASQAPVFTYGEVGNSIEHNFEAGKEYYMRWKPRSLKDHSAEQFQFTDEELHRERQ